MTFSPIKLSILVVLTLISQVRCGEFDIDNVTHPENLQNLKNESAERDQVNAEGQIKNGMGWTVAVVLLTLALVGSLLLNLYQLRKSRKYLPQLTREEIKLFLTGGNPSSGEPDLIMKAYELSKDSFIIDESSILEIGSFGSCKVCMGTITKGDLVERVAVKMVKNPCPKYALMNQLAEIKSLSYLGKHPHFVELRGSYTAEIRKDIVHVFLEFCENGTLLYFLQKIKRENGVSVEELNGSLSSISGTSLSSPGLAEALVSDMSRWSIEIATAMEFIASKGFVHCDITVRNVLLTGNYQAKLSNFGLSCRMEDDEMHIKNKTVPLPLRSMAPESLRRREFTQKTDVWAFGLLLWEIYTLGDDPYAGLAFDFNFLSKLDKGFRLPEPTYNINNIYSVMLRCWGMSPEVRPDFRELVNILSVGEDEEWITTYG